MHSQQASKIKVFENTVANTKTMQTLQPLLSRFKFQGRLQNAWFFITGLSLVIRAYKLILSRIIKLTKISIVYLYQILSASFA